MSTITDIYTNFRAELLGITGVQDIIGNRIYYSIVPRDGQVPGITLNPSDGTRPPFYRGSYDLATLTIQVGIYSYEASEILTLTQLVSSHFNGFSGNLNDNVDALVTRTEVAPFLSLPNEDGINGVVFDIDIQYNGE